MHLCIIYIYAIKFAIFHCILCDIDIGTYDSLRNFVPI